MDAAARTRWVVERARALGFDLCGVARAGDFPELTRLPEWLERGYAGEMYYLHDVRRQSPARVLEGARSVIVCALNYNTSFPYSTAVPANHATPRGWLSRYAWGDDYHDVLREKLDALVGAMRKQFSEPFEARAYVDTGPVVERVAAKRAGLGWLAKNTCLINEQLGSWLFLGVILTTQELAPSVGAAEAPPPDLCGQCTLCIEACPTGAIVEPYVLDARRCISYLTIELRGPVPEEQRAGMGRHVFGCDICQDVCPWNHRAAVTSEPRFQPRRIEESADSDARANGLGTLAAPDLLWLASLDEREFRNIFRGSAVKRTKWQGLVRNACIALGNLVPSGGAGSGVGSADRALVQRVIPVLEHLAASKDAVVADAAHWALSRMKME